MVSERGLCPANTDFSVALAQLLCLRDCPMILSISGSIISFDCELLAELHIFIASNEGISGGRGAQIDRIDRNILRQLQVDAAITNAELSKRVKSQSGGRLRRVEKLRASGLIARTVAVLDPSRIEMTTLVIVGVVLDRSTPASFRRIRDRGEGASAAASSAISSPASSTISSCSGPRTSSASTGCTPTRSSRSRASGRSGRSSCSRRYSRRPRCRSERPHTRIGMST